MKRLIYIAFYSEPDTDENRKSVPAAVTKINYIAGVMKSLGYEPEIYSLCEVNDRRKLFVKYPCYVREINGLTVRFFDRYSSKLRLIRGISLRYSDYKIRRFILKNVEPGDKVVIYHSLSDMHVIKALKRRGVRFALEAEEIYSDVRGSERMRRKEIAHMRCADAFILPTKLMSPELNPEGRPEAIIHGIYRREEDFGDEKFGSEPGARRIHCVYAGTFDPQKGGAAAAVRAAGLLPEDYHVHIIGFGSDKDTEDIKRLISETAKNSRALITYDGLLHGEEYTRFLQRCDIGLSTQEPSAAFSNTSFPSKILSYLSNGLNVVSVRIPVVETSAIGNSIHYYDEQTPESIANAIRSVDISARGGERKLMNELSDNFRNEFKELLERI